MRLSLDKDDWEDTIIYDGLDKSPTGVYAYCREIS